MSNYDRTQELTDEQVERQDDVDNAIFSMLQEVLKDVKIDPDWDMEIIGEIRELIEGFYFQSDDDIYEFYPWVEEMEQ